MKYVENEMLRLKILYWSAIPLGVLELTVLVAKERLVDK
jgi:hypothetical protein